MTADRIKLLELPGVTMFDEVGFALEEAEFLTKSTRVPHSVVGLPEVNGEVGQYLVMERSRAIATAALVLETFRVMDEEPSRGIN